MCGWGMAARVCEIFFYKESGKLFLIKNPNLTKKKSGGWEVRGGEGCSSGK